MKNTCLIFLILSAATIMQAMDKPRNKKRKKILSPSAQATLNNKDLLFCITQQLCTIHRCRPLRVKKDLAALALVNKPFFIFFSQYHNADTFYSRSLVKQMAIRRNIHDQIIARDFGNFVISQKISRLFTIATTEATFTKKDLKDTWYLNATGWCSCYDYRHSTLLLAAIKHYDLPKVKMLLKAGIKLNLQTGENPITFMANINYSTLEREERKSFFAIVRLFLKKGVHPDSRPRITCPTLLQRAVQNNNRHFAYSLLQAGANPYRCWLAQGMIHFASMSIKKRLIQHNPKTPWLRNAFSAKDGVEYADWLKSMHDEVKAQKIKTIHSPVDRSAAQ